MYNEERILSLLDRIESSILRFFLFRVNQSKSLNLMIFYYLRMECLF